MTGTKYNPEHHHRRSIRLDGYDYSQAGAYFVTICTRQRTLFFEDPTIRAIAEECWSAIPEHFPAVELDAWVIMPNHLHGIIVITENRPKDASRGVQLNAPTRPDSPTSPLPKTRDRNNKLSAISPHRDTLAVIIRTIKGAVTTRCRRAGLAEFARQRNYYEHIVRDEDDLTRIRWYIRNNPLQWDTDPNNPKHWRMSS